MKGQTTIFDQVERAKLSGIEASYAHADSYWKKAAAERLQWIVDNGTNFTSDHILIPLEKRGIITRDTRALAAILLAAKRMGLIEATENFVRCQRPSRHHAPIMVWKVVKPKNQGGQDNA